MTRLLPRLPGPAAEQILDEFFANDPTKWAGFDSNCLPEQCRFAATGASRITGNELADLRTKIFLEPAKKCGFPSKANKQTTAEFDALVAAQLGSSELLKSGESLRDDVWNFMSIALAPDIVYWRFGAARERYLGGVRNTFQRLWLRAQALDRGPRSERRWELLELLTEDALVQVSERPSISANSTLAVALGEAWARTAEKLGRPAMEPIMRKVVLRVRMLNEIRHLSLLEHNELAELMDELFLQAS